MAKKLPIGPEGARLDGLSALHAYETGEGINEPPYWAPRNIGHGAAPDPGQRLGEIIGDHTLCNGNIEELRRKIHELYDAGGK